MLFLVVLVSCMAACVWLNDITKNLPSFDDDMDGQDSTGLLN